MPRFAANISLMFNEWAPLDRLAAARDAGFAAVEMQFPYAIPLDDFARARERAQVEVALINIPAGERAKGDVGLGALPGRRAELGAGIAEARRYAEALGVKRVNLLAGAPERGADLARCRATLVDNMRAAAAEMAEIGAVVCIEAINTRDVPGFFVTGSEQAIALIDEAGVPNLALQYDVYHMQIMEGDLIGTLTRLRARIGHIQFADTPGRHEPGTGEIDFADVFAALDRIGYAGWLGAEYRPSGATLASLGWFQAWRQAAATGLAAVRSFTGLESC
ncbi:MAG: hydroxypyruvate isomerase family protein [Pseudomonadota bacterium]